MPSVMIVEDEEQLANAICHFIVTAYPETLECVHRQFATEALEYLASNRGADVSLLFVDLQLAGMGGRELVRQTFDRIERLRGRIVVCTGETLYEDDPLFVKYGCHRLDKPFEIEAMRDILRKAVLHG